MSRNQFAHTEKTLKSPCCECGEILGAATGPRTPFEGDFALCIKCASLNIYCADLSLRRPNDDEIFEAAKNSELQALRRAILKLHAKGKNT